MECVLALALAALTFCSWSSFTFYGHSIRDPLIDNTYWTLFFVAMVLRCAVIGQHTHG
eukprot:SAG11_NODE_23785_length_383_cov_0.725352_1_plen_57_part_10